MNIAKHGVDKPEHNIDISLVLNLHREGKFLHRTLLSLKDAVDYARVLGLSTELIVVLDRPDQATETALASFELSYFDDVEVVTVDRGSLGLARNDGIAHARGRYVRLCDGDDLISYNLIFASYVEAVRLGQRAIFVAERLFAFGDRSHCVHYRDLDVITPLAMIDIHPYVSQIFAHRSLFDELKFADLRLSVGYAYEDWHFATEAVALGYTFHAARNTAFFYRQRKGSLLTQANALSINQIAPSRLFLPSVFTRICSDAYRRLRAGKIPRECEDTRDYIHTALGKHQIHAANAIEPGIDFDGIARGDSYSVEKASNLEIGRRYFEICLRLGDAKFTDIFVLPDFWSGGAARYILNVIVELGNQVDGASILLIIGEPHDGHHCLDQLPGYVTLVDLAAFIQEIGTAGIDLITLKLVQSLGPDARLHFRQSVYGERFFARFGRALTSNKRIYYRFCQEIHVRNGLNVIAPWGFDFLSDQIEHIDAVITDNEKVIEFDTLRLGICQEKWHCLLTRGQAVHRSPPEEYATGPKRRILWASRLVMQKRPRILPHLAELLKPYGFELDVFGEATQGFGASLFDGCQNIHFHGAYERFSDIVSPDHLCFLYTSYFDGIPTVLLEAAGAGLPIVAPDVGAISEFIEDERTGLLLADEIDDEKMAEAYVTAIQRLANDPALRSNVSESAFQRATLLHGPDAYKAGLARLLEAISG